MARLAMLIDLTRCIGCDACTVACKQENGTPADVFFARVLNVEAGTYLKAKRVYIPILCYHCENPPCLKACPNKAIFKRPDGVVLIDQERCRSMGACVSACPYGNIILSRRDSWYLNEDEPYERDFVKPRLRSNVARKCTYCVHRVDEGLDPACVEACPTTARIFGDLDDPTSPISTYIAQEIEQTGRSPFHLLPEAGTKPAGCYLGTMATQAASTLGGRAAPERSEPLLVSSPERSSSVGGRPTTFAFWRRGLRRLPALLILAAALGLASYALPQGASQPAAQPAPAAAKPATDFYGTSSCIGCHGMTAMGGLGPPLPRTKLTEQEFLDIVRKGKGMMPGTSERDLSDDEVRAIFGEVKAKPWDENQIPIAYKVGQMLTTRNVGILFLFVTLFALIFGVKVWVYWIKLSAPKQLWSAVRKFGVLRSAGVLTWSLFVDGFLVASLWRASKPRWLMHGFMLYGFCGLFLADILMQIFNPTRADLPLLSPLKLLPILSGAALLTGVLYVMSRYRRDPYIDNGMTQGRDFLFLNLLFHAVLSGFLTLVINRSGATGWVMPIYLYHLGSVLMLLATAPFTRFMHVWIVPTMVALTRLTEEIARSGVELGFEREPSPGRHHKSLRIAEQVMRELGPDYVGPLRLRYYP